MSLTLYNGDCLDVMKTLPDASVDLILCDLPYGCLSGRAIGKAAEAKKMWSGDEMGCVWDVPIDLAAFWEQVRRIRKADRTPCIHFCTTKFGYDLIKSNEKEFRYDLVWTKTNAVGFLAANKMPMRAHEMMYVFSKTGAAYERIDISGNFPAGGGGRSTANFMPINDMPNLSQTVEAGRRCVKSYIQVANKKTRGGHPTAKPIELYAWLIERYCPAGGTVLDPTFGSGNSGAAAEALGRNYIGIEKDPRFFEKAAKNLGAI
mgnify:CR=1 FL=1